MTADNKTTPAGIMSTTAAAAASTTHLPPTARHLAEIPARQYRQEPVLVCPDRRTPQHTLYLSNLDDQKFLRFSIKYIYVYRKSIPAESLQRSLSSVLSDYYPLAGRLRRSSYCTSDDDDDDDDEEDDRKLVVDCNGEGALFAEAFMDYTADEFLRGYDKPEVWWRKLLIYRVEGARSILDLPPLVAQVTYLRCGGMILCTAINHCLCDGIGTSQFLNAWANHTSTTLNLIINGHTVVPYHSRHLLKPGRRSPPSAQLIHHYPQLTLKPTTTTPTIIQQLQSLPLIPTSTTFTPDLTLRLKRHLSPPLKCTTFETLAAHTWRSWVRSIFVLPTTTTTVVKLLFSVNIRDTLALPPGYYGNAFVLACAHSTVSDLLSKNLRHAVKLVQQAKAAVMTEAYVRGMVDVMEDKRVRTDLEATLVISQWSRLGLEEVDFGAGNPPVHMGPLTSDVYCLFLPVVTTTPTNQKDSSVRVSVSMPESVAPRFKRYMMMRITATESEFTDDEKMEKDDATDHSLTS